MQFNLAKANHYIPHILLIGLGIGTANYFMNGNLNWFQWILQSLSTSFIIGYTLVIVASNRFWFESHVNSWPLYLVLIVLFFLTGGLASEVEQLIRSILFNKHTYRPFSGGNIYVFNGIITTILGFSFFHNRHLFPVEKGQEPQVQDNQEPEPADLSGAVKEATDEISKVPVKQGENILLIPVQDIVYFEAFDNYSFVYDSKGEKRLCDYSLLFLEKRLGRAFIRIHRKYIANTQYIKQVKPHLNSRYLIIFESSSLAPITSSKSYSSTIRKLIKIE